MGISQPPYGVSTILGQKWALQPERGGECRQDETEKGKQNLLTEHTLVQEAFPPQLHLPLPRAPQRHSHLQLELGFSLKK